MFSKSIALAALPMLLLTGCSNAATPSAEPTKAATTACLVVDARGLKDGGVNESAYSAIKEAVVSDGVNKFAKVVGAKATPDEVYSAVNHMVRRGCNVIVTSGTKLRAATVKSALANPDIAYVLIDDVLPIASPVALADNLRHLTFDSGQSAILAGYLAAANSKTGLVATFGSFNTPPVLASMQGFEQGVQLYNNDTDSNVSVCGLTSDNSGWTFIGTNTSVAKAKSVTAGFIADGADVIYPVAGAASAGAGKALIGLTDKWVIGSERDWYLDTDFSKWKGNVLASTTKQVSRPVLAAINAYVATKSVGDPATNEYAGTLANGGVALSEEHSVPFAPAFNSALNDLISKINSGEISTPKGTK
jgi:basic membrane protein A